MSLNIVPFALKVRLRRMTRTVKGFVKKINNLWAHQLVIHNCYAMFFSGILWWTFFCFVVFFFVGASACTTLSEALQSLNLPLSRLLQQLQPSDRRPRPSNWRDALGIWNLENVGRLHPLWGRWKGTSFPFRHCNVCLWGHDLIGPDNWNKAAIHSSRGTGKYKRGRIGFTEHFSVGNN